MTMELRDFTKWLYNPKSELLFHYTSITAVKEILKTGHILFGQLNNTNDPFENYDWDIGLTKWGGTGKETTSTFIQAEINTRSIKKFCHLFCTTMNKTENFKTFPRGFSIPSLWAHYAVNRKGACLVFNKNSLIQNFYLLSSSKQSLQFANKINYNGPLRKKSPAFNLDITDISSDNIETHIKKHIIEYYKEFFFTKDISWAYENEFRFLIINDVEKDFTLPIYPSLKGIILGDNIDTKNELQIFESYLSIYGQKAQIEWENGRPIVYPTGINEDDLKDIPIIASF